MDLDPWFLAAARGLLWAGLFLFAGFFAFEWWSLRAIPRGLLRARFAIEFDPLVRGLAWMAVGFLAVLLAHIPTMLALPAAPALLAAGAALWVVSSALAMRLFHRALRVPQEVRRRWVQPTESQSP